VKIQVSKIPPEGLTLEGAIDAAALDLDTDMIFVKDPVSVEAQITLITNTVTAEVSIRTSIHALCSRCLCDFAREMKKKFRLTYIVNKPDQEIDMTPDIREEIILDYPIKPLCQEGCKGLCHVCGENLNEGKCTCKRE
jgi:uncharacterized protein